MSTTKTVKTRGLKHSYKNPPPDHVFTELGAKNYTIKQICSCLSINNETLYKMFKAHPRTREALELGWTQRYNYLIKKRDSIIDDPNTPPGDVLRAIDRELEFKHQWIKPVEQKNLNITLDDFDPSSQKAIDINIRILNPKDDEELKMIPELVKDDTIIEAE